VTYSMGMFGACGVVTAWVLYFESQHVHAHFPDRCYKAHDTHAHQLSCARSNNTRTSNDAGAPFLHISKFLARRPFLPRCECASAHRAAAPSSGQVIRTKPYPWKSECNLFDSDCMKAYDAAQAAKH